MGVLWGLLSLVGLCVGWANGLIDYKSNFSILTKNVELWASPCGSILSMMLEVKLDLLVNCVRTYVI